jgi:GNAT superfamily N-acetyltransferase
MTLPTLDRPALIRHAVAEDLPEVHRMLIALAARHGLPVTITPAVLGRIARGQAARILVAFRQDSPQRHPAGYALVLLERNMIAGADWGFVEQLYVQTPDRGRGIGRALLAAAKAEAVAAGCAGQTVSTRPVMDGATLAFRAVGPVLCLAAE